MGETINSPGELFRIPLDQLRIASLFEKLVKSLSNPLKKFPEKDWEKELSSGNAGLYLLLFIVISLKAA